jgi:nucleoside-diphosphate-sugar epimerase
LKKKKLVLVTGSCGFVGRNLLEQLLKKNISITGSYYRKKNFIKNSDIKYIQIDTSDRKDVENIFPVPDVIVHLSNAVFTSGMLNDNKKINFDSNLLSMINLLEFCKAKKVKKFIYVSSSTGYPKSRHRLKEDDYFSKEPPIEFALVGSLSRILEKIIKIYKGIYNFNTKVLILRPSAIYGRYDNFHIRHSRLIPRLIKKITLNNSFIKVPGSGSFVRNWVNATEFANLIIKLIFLKRKEHIFTLNVSSCKSYSTIEVAKKILRILNKKNFNIKKTVVFEKKLNARILDSYKMKKLGLTVDSKGFDFYLKEMIKWYRQRI